MNSRSAYVVRYTCEVLGIISVPFRSQFLFRALSRTDTLPHVPERTLRHFVGDVHRGWVTPSNNVEGRKLFQS